MLRSMTGFAAMQGHVEGWAWSWEMRGVNGRGLDLRLRLPEGIDGLEAAVRAMLQKSLVRGNVSLTLRLNRTGGSGLARIDPAVLDRTLDEIAEIEAAALAHGVNLVASRATDILSIRGVLDASGQGEDDTAPLKDALLAQMPALLAAFDAMRRAEGTALHGVLSGQIDEIAQHVATARDLCAGRAERTAQTLRANLARVLDNSDGADPDRVAQELALIAVKSDVTEEIDRLDAHVAAARDLLGAAEASGRKLDFLTQEFNREANTLCAKAGAIELTRVGLALKSAIDQMREQVQNVE